MLPPVPTAKPAALTRRYSKVFESASAMAVTQKAATIANKPAKGTHDNLNVDVHIESSRRLLCNPFGVENSKRNDGVYWRKSVLSLGTRLIVAGQ
jgi:hypothetical protein